MDGDNQNQVPGQAPTPDAGWSYKPEGGPAPYQPPAAEMSGTQPGGKSELEWTASEFVAHKKGLGWYSAFGLASVVIVAGAYLITREILPAILVAMATGIFAWTASRPPRVLEYRLVSSGVYIGSQYYPFSEYKSFSIVDEGAFSSLMLWPLKRFSLPVGLYYDPAQEEEVINTVSRHLPMQQHPNDLIDNIMRRIRF